MAASTNPRPGSGRTTTHDAVDMVAVNTKEQSDREVVDDNIVSSNANDDEDDISKPDSPIGGIQRGVQDVENITQSWSKSALVAVFIK